MFKAKIATVLIIGIVLVVAVAGVLWLWVISAVNDAGNRSTQTRFVIEQGQGVNGIAGALKSQGIIASERLFSIAVMMEGASNSLKAGEYVIPASASIKDIVKLFSGGATDEELEVRLKEETKLIDIAEDIEDQTGIPADDFLAAAQLDVRTLFPEALFPSLSDKPSTATLEGYLYPDTYRVFKDARAEDIIFKALTNFETKLTQDDRDAIQQQGKTIFDIIILASIVEREEPNPEERPTVAGVFWNRIDAGIPLQSDATVNYVSEANNPRPTFAELQIDSPYNTYRYAGLPPGPISNPTIDSIRSVIEYTETDYFYFLHPQDGSGRTIYGRTLEEHNQNRQLYLD